MFLCLLVSERSFGQLDQGDFIGGGRDNVLYQFDASTGLMNPIEGAELDTWEAENGMTYATDDNGNLFADINNDGHFDRDEAIDWESNMTNTTSSTTTNTSSTSSSSSDSEGSFVSWGGGYSSQPTSDPDDDSSNDVASSDSSQPSYPSGTSLGTSSTSNYSGDSSSSSESIIEYIISPTVLCKTSKEDLKALFPDLTDAKASQLADLLNKYAAKFGIDTIEKMQHFLAQAGYESKSFNDTQELTNYQVGVAKQKFGQLFKENNKDISDFGTVLNNKGIKYIKDREAFFNFIYDDAVRSKVKGWSKNGNTNPGDGYKFIGRGIIQVTGREKYTDFTNWYQKNINPNLNFVTNPELLNTNFEIGVLASLWFFEKFVIGKLYINTSTTSFKVTILVNPKGIDADIRDKNFIKAKTLIKCN